MRKLLGLEEDFNFLPYASAIVLELRQSKYDSSEYYIKVYFKNNTANETIQLRPMTMKGCEELCPLKSFSKMMQDKVITDFNTACGLPSVLFETQKSDIYTMAQQLTAELKAKIDEWLRWDKVGYVYSHVCVWLMTYKLNFFKKNVKTRTEIEDLVKANSVKELESRLLERMSFGTAGLRSRMGAGYSMMNDLTIIQTTQVCVVLVFDCNPIGVKIIN